MCFIVHLNKTETVLVNCLDLGCTYALVLVNHHGNRCFIFTVYCVHGLLLIGKMNVGWSSQIRRRYGNFELNPIHVAGQVRNSWYLRLNGALVNLECVLSSIILPLQTQLHSLDACLALSYSGVRLSHFVSLVCCMISHLLYLSRMCPSFFYLLARLAHYFFN
jgi:hypothetical protein